MKTSFHPKKRLSVKKFSRPMSNKTLTETPFYDLGLGVPLWVVIVWAAVGCIILVMVIVILYVCWTRTGSPVDKRDTEEEELDQLERQRSITLITDSYPQGFIDELHTINPTSNKTMFQSNFVNNMQIPRATEVKMVASENGVAVTDHLHHTACAAENSGLAMDELTVSFNNHDYGNVDEDEDFTELHASRKINISREASFRTSNISEESKARQILREKMLVNELREKIRREKRTIDEESK